MSKKNIISLIRDSYLVQKEKRFTPPFIFFTIPFKIFTNVHIFLTMNTLIHLHHSRDLIDLEYHLHHLHHQITELFLHQYDNH